MTDDVTNLSEIDWDNVERERHKAVVPMPIIQAVLFLAIGAVVLIKAIVDYTNGTIEPYGKLTFLTYLLSGILTMVGIFILINLRRS